MQDSLRRVEIHFTVGAHGADHACAPYSHVLLQLSCDDSTAHKRRTYKAACTPFGNRKQGYQGATGGPDTGGEEVQATDALGAKGAEITTSLL